MTTLDPGREAEASVLPASPACPHWCLKDHEVDMGLPSLPASNHFIEVGRVSQRPPMYVFIPVLIQRVDLLPLRGAGTWVAGNPSILVGGSHITLKTRREVEAALRFESLMFPGVADLVREAAEIAGILPATPISENGDNS